MDRRRFLHGLLAATAATAFTPRLFGAERAVFAGSPPAGGLDSNAGWRTGWRNAPAAVLPRRAATVEGRWPSGLRGTLYRNGPARFERAGFRYHHWFDGDGMVHAWRCDGQAVTHQARMVATSKFTREEEAGRFLLPTAGTTVPDAIGIRNNDDINVANTAVIRFDGRLFALWEGGSAYELDPDTLATLGPVRWRDDLVAAPFSAHPLVDADGSLWNFGSLDMLGGSGLLVWHIGADGALVQAQVLESTTPGYLHAFAMTERYLVFVLSPFRQQPGSGAFFERLRFDAAQPARIAVVDKDALDAPRWFETDFAAIYHFGDAWQQGDTLHVRAIRHFDVDAMRSPMRQALQGEAPPRPRRAAELSVLRLDLRSGRAHWEAAGLADVEFPVVAGQRTGASSRLLMTQRSSTTATPWFDCIAALDRGRVQRWHAGNDVMVEEPRFVPRGGDDDGWVLATLLDTGRQRTGLAVLDARHIDTGPLATAWLDQAMPLGFHGWFAAA